MSVCAYLARVASDRFESQESTQDPREMKELPAQQLNLLSYIGVMFGRTPIRI